MIQGSAMAKLGTKTLITDKIGCSITVYRLSDYGQYLHDAVVLYNKGLYSDAEPLWREVLRYNANSDIAHVGIGKVYYMNGQYKEAMNEFKLANDRENYSRSYELYRKRLYKKQFRSVHDSDFDSDNSYRALALLRQKRLLTASKEKKRGVYNKWIRLLLLRAL